MQKTYASERPNLTLISSLNYSLVTLVSSLNHKEIYVVTQGLLFFNSFIEIQLTYHMIHLLKVYNSMVLVCSQDCVTITTINFGIFSSIQKKPPTHWQSLPVSRQSCSL